MIGSFSFLFDSSHSDAPSSYGARFNPAFMRALKRADPAGETHSWILLGDMLTHNLAMKITKVEHDGNRSSRTMGYDRDVLKTAIFDFTQWVAELPSRFDPEQLLERLLRLHVFHCVTVPTVNTEIAMRIDSALRTEPLYLGVAAIDRSNPVLVTLLMEYLVRSAGVSQGRIWLEADYDGDVFNPFETDEGGNGDIVSILDMGGLSAKFGPLPQLELSQKGAKIAERYRRKTRSSLQERVLQLLADRWDERGGSFRFDAIGDVSRFEAIVPPPKLTHYALDPAHPKGGSKAKFFNDVLAIGPTDWKYLYAQILSGVLDAPLADVTMKRWEGGYGVSFNANLGITGLNGRVANVFTNWIMEPDGLPRLSTIMPTDENSEGHIATEPPIVGSALKGDAKWERLYELANEAGTKAHDDAVPTPMFIEGFGGQGDGECGFGYVHVPDARRDFARWLLKNGHAYKGYRGGATISCPRDGQSVDRAFAYATAFARVLELNGVDCSTERRLD